MFERADFIKGKRSIAIHGCGFIGMSTAMYYAKEGVKSIAYDINPQKIENMRNGVCDVQNLETWSQMKLKPFVDSGVIAPTNKLEETMIREVGAHFIAVPTEQGGKPFLDYVVDTLDGLREEHDTLIVIESTLAPNWIRPMGLDEMPNVCIAPRRDWFGSTTNTLPNLPRIYCGSTIRASDQAHELLSLVCKKLIRASNMRIAILGGKCIENSILHIVATYAQQLIAAYPNEDMAEALRLANTHPRMASLGIFGNFKVGGYCVELGSQYVSAGAEKGDVLKLCKDAIEQNARNTEQTLSKFDFDGKTVGILGITYKNDLKVDTLAAVHPTVKYVRERNSKRIMIHDPYYTAIEIDTKFGETRLEYPDHLFECDTIIILTDHHEYYQTPLNTLLSYINNGAQIIDALGVWSRYREFFEENGIKYWCYGVGDAP